MPATRKTKPALLVLDLGNTRASLGLYRGRRLTKRLGFGHADMRDQPARVEKALASTYGHDQPLAAIVASVVPSRNDDWRQGIRRSLHIETRFIDHRWDFGMPIDYPSPSRLGIDRLVNAARAYHTHGAPVIVCDAGTCVTLDLVLPERGFVGGVILPGLAHFTTRLADTTELLPCIRPAAPPRRPYGRSTREAVLIGAHRGFEAMILACLEELREAATAPCPLHLTGGDAPRLTRLRAAPHTAHEPHATLAGIGTVGILQLRSEQPMNTTPAST